ncbi:MAG: M48 family metalloprotease [Rubrimonas sp.]|uniref:M48 family metalloprotease n=1 Tax=Rubrimonas sp. TaxID=2036015 RepID=UPI002FDEC40F
MTPTCLRMVQFLIVLAGVAILALANYQIGLSRLRRTLREKARPLDDPKLQAAVARLAQAAEVPDLRAELFEMPVVNGLATPDGRVYLTTALFDKYRFGLLTVEEVASVVAHELGHVGLGHHQRRLIDWTGQSVAALALGVLLNRFVPILGFYVANFLAGLLMARLSRRDEFEADRYATALMLKAGFGHRPQIEMFRKLERMVPGPKPAAWLASHPPVAERIAAIEANVAAWSVEPGAA